MNDSKENIIMDDGCLAERAIFRYLENDLSADELLAVEKHLAECEMCSDALEGYKLLNDKEKAAKIISEIKAEITEKTRPGQKDNKFVYLRFLAYAASLVLISGSVLLIYVNLKKQEGKQISEYRPVKPEMDKAGEIKDKEDESRKVENPKVIVTQQGPVEESKPVTGKSAYKFEDLALDKTVDEDVNIPDNLVLSDQKQLPVTIHDAEAEQKKPMVVSGITTADDSNFNNKREESAKNEVIAGQKENLVLEEVVVTTKTEKKSKSTGFRKRSDAPAKEKAKDTRISDGDEISISGERNAEQSVLDYQTDILKKNPEDYSALYYSGVSFFNLKKYKKCIKQLDRVIMVKNAEFYEDALWYKLQALIELNRKAEALPLLDSLITGGKKYSKQAEEKKVEMK